MIGTIIHPLTSQYTTVTGLTTSNQVVRPSKDFSLRKVTVNPVPGNQLGNATAQDVVTGKTFSSSAGVNIAGTGVKSPKIYGVTWSGTDTSSLTRTDDAANFSAPRPYCPGATGTPSSPFDTILPLAGMRRVTDSVAGELVEIPKYYYKLTKSGSTLQLQISNAPVAGFYVSPAHMNRGDGFGERDYVYVSRYHVNSSYKSVTGVVPKGNATISSFRTGIANLRSDILQIDFAMYLTVFMLYLVEYADLCPYKTIGVGLELTDPPAAEGGCDNMPYHTGTMGTYLSMRASNQYRYISDFSGQLGCYIDGVAFYNENSYKKAYVTINPSKFDETRAAGGGSSINVNIPNTSGVYGRISSFAIDSTVFQCPIPNGLVTTSTGYYTDCIMHSNDKGILLYVNGISQFSVAWNSSDKWTTIGSRSMVLPFKRI